VSAAERVIAAERLRVVFRKTGDRWSHMIERLVDADWHAILTSFEGVAGDNRPPSPALQELELQDESALGVGMSGRNHWSMSVTARAGELTFDIACRLREEASVGSTYTVAQGIEVVEVSAGLRFSLSGAECLLIVNGANWNYEMHRLRLECAADGAATRRWQYTVA
jgi:hypothetical protein